MSPISNLQQNAGEIPFWAFLLIGSLALAILVLAVVLAVLLVSLQKRQRKNESPGPSADMAEAAPTRDYPDLIFRLSQDGTFLDYHTASGSRLFVPPSAFLGKKINEVLPEEIAALAILKTKDALLTKETQSFKYHLPVDNKIRFFEARLKANDNGEVTAMIRDITEGEQIEKNLRESEQRYQTLTRVSPVGIFHTDREGYTTYVNPSWSRLSGLPSEDALGNGWLKAVHPEDKERVMRNWEDSAKESRPSNADYRFIHSDGSITWVIGQAVPEQDENGEVVGYVGTITDITEHKKMEELKEAVIKAETADKLKSAFLATMSHELRTPLNSIIGFTGILLQKLVGPLNTEQEKQLRMIQESSRHLLALINDVLDISKIEAGQMPVALEPVDMQQTIQDSLSKIQPWADKKKLKVTSAVSPEIPKIMSDSRRVEQILINLLNNAVKFTEQGEIHIDARVEGKKVITCIRDTGIGIKPEDLKSLFKPFSQVQTGLTRQYQGTGLGLSICKHLLTLLGGEISVKSEEGKGSEFTFTLPIGAEKR